MTAWTVRETNEGVQFKIKVQPRSSKNEICGIQGDALKLRLTAPPVEGAANEACIDFFAELLHTTKKSLQILSGQTSQHKIILIHGLTKADLLKRLDMAEGP